MSDMTHMPVTHECDTTHLSMTHVCDMTHMSVTRVCDMTHILRFMTPLLMTIAPVCVV